MTKEIAIGTPLQLLERAVSAGANIDTLEKLMDLQAKWEAGEAKKKYYAAMQQFASIRPTLVRNSAVEFNKTKYKFCALPDIEKALREPLSDCGLFYRFENFTEGSEIGIRCIVSHVAGHSEATPMKAPVDSSGNKNNIQGIGSTSTYLMRYTLIAAFGLTTADEDDDGVQNSDLPYQRVLRQNELLRDANLLKVIVDIKECLAQNDYETVVGYMAAMPEETKSAIWMAPSKGGIFTTQEIAQIRSNEFVAVRTEYYKTINDISLHDGEAR